MLSDEWYREFLIWIQTPEGIIKFSGFFFLLLTMGIAGYTLISNKDVEIQNLKQSLECYGNLSKKLKEHFDKENELTKEQFIEIIKEVGLK